MKNEDLLVRLIRWVIETIGLRALLILTLLLAGMGSVIFGLSKLLRDLDFSLLVFLTLTGVLAGWWLASRRLPGWTAAGLILLAGILLVTFPIGRLWSPLSGVFGAWAGLVHQGWPWRPADWSAFLTALSGIGLPLRVLIERLLGWTGAFARGEPAFDPVASSMIWNLAFWSLAAWSGWATRRWRQPLEAMAPVGAVLAIGLNLAGGDTPSLLLFLGVTLLLKATVDQDQREQTWQRERIDYSEDLLLDYSVVTLLVVIVLVTTAGLAPSLSIRRLSNLARALTHNQAEEARQVGESLGLKRKPQPVRPGFTRYAPGMPRSHLLGAGPELSQQVALVVQTGDLPPNPPNRITELAVPRYYWRSQTYDRYTGRGWVTSQTDVQSYPPGEPAVPWTMPEHRLLNQSVELMGTSNAGGNAVFVSGTLVNLADREYQVDRRRTPQAAAQGKPAEFALQSNSDLFGALVNDQTYRAVSLVPVVNVDELRQAGQNYPDWLRERYLALPGGIPARVLALGRELTATQPTPYDRAKAIETYLRSIPYTLDLPAPPTNRDVVDYFLFTLKRGYCDYYASSMVILARAAGLPARLVMGYASGTYDAPNASYIVTEANAHSWPEIYFPGYGWIEFEPTAGQPALELPEAATTGSQPSLSPGESTSAVALATGKPAWPWRTGLIWGGVILVGASLIFFLFLIADTWLLRFLPPAVVLTRIFRDIYRRGHRLDLTLRPGDTPFEFTNRIEQLVGALSKSPRRAWLLQPMTQDLRQLAKLYAQNLYSPTPAGRPEKRQAIQTWGRLRWRLWLAQLLQSGQNRPKPGV